MIRKIVSVLLACTFCLSFSPIALAATVEISRPIPITATVSLSGSATLTVTPVGTIGFDTGGVSVIAPWTDSAGYLDVVYTSTYNATNVGVRIVSRNAVLIDPVNPPYTNLDTYISPAFLLDPGGNPTIKVYSGLIYEPDLDLGTIGEDPSKRATLAWQVFNAAQGSITVPASSIGSGSNGGTALIDKTGDTNGDNTCDVLDRDTVGPWNAAWAYVGDVSDDGFSDMVWDGATDGPAYPIMASGITEISDGYLAQHPMDLGTADPTHPDPRTADGDVAIYLAGRFANTNWNPSGPSFPYKLPAGNYKVALYVELLYE